MKLSVFLMFVAVLSVSAEGFSQHAQVSLELKNASLKKIMKGIKKEAGYSFLYRDEEIQHYPSKDFSVEEADMEQVMGSLLEGTDLTYEVENDVIILVPKNTPIQKVEDVVIQGKVTDEKGEPIPGVTIIQKGISSGVVTDIDGNYSLTVPEDAILVFSFIGMETVEELVTTRSTIDIQMKESTTGLEEVVVNGYAPFKKATFTGSAVTMKSDEILRLSTTDVLSAISVLEPNFRLDENLLTGSDPNRLPDYTIRGKGSLDVNDFRGNPNAPLFILDGFEVAIEKIYDLDINRIASISVLKDASATAIYGSRAANGIIVLETKKPEAGKLTLTINSNTVINAPDLTSYDVLNAEEKLLLEQEAGLFVSEGAYESTKLDLREREQWLSNNVKRGVNTYWLGEPVQTSVDQQFALYLQGGNESTTYGVDANYKTRNGVMKGSERDIFSMGFNLSYRHKNLKFRNYLSVDFGNQTETPYGDYSDYVLANPYYISTNTDGSQKEFLEFSEGGGVIDGQTRTESNPLYNASLSSSNKRKYTNILEQLMIDWDITDYLRWSTQLSLTSKQVQTSDFVSPLDTRFSNYDTEQRGTLTNSYEEYFDWNVKSAARFNKDFSGHFVSLNVGMEVFSNSYAIEGYVAEGFPNDQLNSLAFATQYQENGKPSAVNSLTNTVGFFSNASYTYNNRYFVNGSIRMDGSSAFGSNNRFAPFWSAGLGWNVHNESFFTDSNIVSLLKVRGSVGTTGTVQFNSSQSLRIYQYNQSRRYRGLIGSTLLSPGNEDLQWQSRFKSNAGVDMGLLNNRLNVTVDYYVETTTNLLADVTLAPSTGFSAYKENLGEVTNTGFEFKLSGTVYKTSDANVSLFINAAQNKSEITKLSDALKSYNDSQDALNEGDEPQVNAPLTRYAEGQSYTAIWGVPSLGIDPADGQELFRAKNGEITNVWNSADIDIIGDTQADLYGFFGTNARYKGFELQASFRFSYGGQKFNQTLLDRIENADITANTDRRVLESRWKQPGDVVSYKDVQSTSVTKVSSRFVQDENFVQFSNVSFGYNFNTSVLEKLKMSKLKVALLASDIFYASTINQERGINYPFARSFTFSVSANF